MIDFYTPKYLLQTSNPIDSTVTFNGLMFEFIPILKKSLVSEAKSVKAAANSALRKAAQTVKKELTNEWPGRTHKGGYGTSISLNRILPGPTLTPNFDDYYIAFKEKHGDNINSAKESWRATNYYGVNKMKCGLTFMTTRTADTPGTTLLLNIDAKRYMFGNIGEGTQRAAIQRKTPLTKLSEIFLTGPIKWATTGGIIGTILTLADGVASRRASKITLDGPNSEERQWLNINGGENLTHALATARRFVFRKGYPIRTQEYRAGTTTLDPDLKPTWTDSYLQVWAMVLEPEVANPARKRSHDDFANDDVPAIDPTAKFTADELDVHDQLRKGVLTSMFDSQWAMDALVSKKLSEVSMPAQIFVKDSAGDTQKYEGPAWDSNGEVEDIDVLVRLPWPGALIQDLPPTKPVHNSISYVVKLFPQRGKFDPKAAKNLGVKPGPDFRTLTSGSTVTTADGNVVKPEQVLGPGKEGGGFVVFDLPDRSYVKAAISQKELSAEKIMKGVEAIIWILGPGVVDDPLLQSFMKERSELKHIVSSPDTCSNYITMESATTQAINLRLIDPDRFPIPVHKNYVEGRSEESNLPYQDARIGKSVQLEPRFEIQDDKINPYLDTAAVVKAADVEVLKLAMEARTKIEDPEYLKNLAESQTDLLCKDAEVISLGTGSAAPSKYRNVSGTLLRVPGYGSYLLDCGENTLGQLKRVFGPKELPAVLRDLKAIWISHLHADHHLGTTSLITAWHEATKNDEAAKNNKLIISSHEGMLHWLKEYSSIEDYGYDRLETVPLGGPKNTLFKKFKAEETMAYGLSRIDAVHVEHCAGALAVVLTFPNGFRVAYSGDCRPSRKFAYVGSDSTLLIHEATFDDELSGDAYAKKHSTTTEALNIGRMMRAKRILLTHFSQRYQKIPVMDSDNLDQIAIVAFDYMRVKLGDFAKVEHFKPALMKLYEDDEEVQARLQAKAE